MDEWMLWLIEGWVKVLLMDGWVNVLTYWWMSEGFDLLVDEWMRLLMVVRVNALTYGCMSEIFDLWLYEWNIWLIGGWVKALTYGCMSEGFDIWLYEWRLWIMDRWVNVEAFISLWDLTHFWHKFRDTLAASEPKPAPGLLSSTDTFFASKA